LVKQGTLRETLTKFYQMPKVHLLKTKTNTYSVSKQKDKIDMGLLNSLGQNYNKNKL